jgi:hypothetical protein
VRLLADQIGTSQRANIGKPSNSKDVMLDYAKAIYEAIGIESPRAFIAACALLGMLL